MKSKGWLGGPVGGGVAWNGAEPEDAMSERRKKARTEQKRPAGIQSMDPKLYEQLQRALKKLAAVRTAETS